MAAKKRGRPIPLSRQRFAARNEKIIKLSRTMAPVDIGRKFGISRQRVYAICKQAA
jgi:hypothetical protein